MLRTRLVAPEIRHVLVCCQFLSLKICDFTSGEIRMGKTVYKKNCVRALRKAFSLSKARFFLIQKPSDFARFLVVFSFIM